MLIFLRHPGQILDRTLGQILDQNNFRTCTGLAAGGEKMRRVVSKSVTTAKVLGEQALTLYHHKRSCHHFILNTYHYNRTTLFPTKSK